MTHMNIKKLAWVIVFLATSQAYAQNAPIIINNNQTAPAPQQSQQQASQPGSGSGGCNANQNDIYDPRVPPAGAYNTKNSDGSSEQLYTTGEKKPYITDNNCGSSSQQPIIQPYVNFQPPTPAAK